MEGKKRINDLLKAAAHERKKQEKGSGITKDFLIIALGDAMLGFHIEYLREVFDLPDVNDIIPLPFVPEYLQGVINVRGEIVPVLDLAAILGFKSTERASTKMVIIEERFKISFPVREIIDMKTLDMKDWRSVRDPRQKAEEQLVTQEFSYNDSPVGVVDVLKLYASKYLV